ncbi:hypothetical protein BH09PLA1_BH09PLA1_11490 [soil metagenome]
MSVRQLDVPPAISDQPAPITLVSSPNWTAILFLATLGGLHSMIAIPAFAHHRWEGYMSALLATGFLCAACVIYFARSYIVFDAVHRRIRVRSGVGRFHFQRWISFDDVHAVRLTMSSSDRPRSRVEVLCDNEDIQCPPNNAPRQEALCLAILLNVQLIKVWADAKADEHTSRV